MLIDTDKNTKYLDGKYYFFDISESRRSAYWDFSNLKGEEGKKIIKDFVDFYKESKFLNVTGNAIIDVTNTRFSKEIVMALKEISRAAQKVIYERTKLAVIGSVGMSKVFLNIFSKVLKKDIKAFNSKEEAIEWLAESD